jgi:hypothetical protein
MGSMTRPPSMISPPSGGTGGGRAGGMAIVENAEAIARLYRRLVLLVGLQILLAVARVPLLVAAPPGLLGLVAVAVGVVVLGASLILSVTAYQLAGQMGLGSPLAWAVAMFLPCINILSLLVLSSKAQAWCKQNDIQVGLLGPTRESIEELRRRVMTAPFN